MIKKKLIQALIFICFCPLFIPECLGDQGVQGLLDGIKSSLEQGDFAAYLNLFAPELREIEEKSLQEKFEQLKLEKVTVFDTPKRIEIESGVRTYLNLVFENTYSVMTAMWRLDSR